MKVREVCLARAATNMTSIGFLPQEIIRSKRDGGELNTQTIHEFVSAFTRGELPDYQMSALLMAIYFRGLSPKETLDLTQAMRTSGAQADFSDFSEFRVDKHSTGGVGDKTSLILGPIVAAAGVPVPMISGRGLGHTGGTLDKLESIPGFKTQLSLLDFQKQVRKHRLCFIGQTQEVCPADRKIYALRDVTATVESIPLICASILSKKLAEGIDGLVLDVKYGSGAFMKTLASATELATRLKEIAELHGKHCSALITSMDQPLGRFAGNAPEIFECVEILKGNKFLGEDGLDCYADTRWLSIELSAHMIWMAKKANDLQSARDLASEMISSGKAFAKFEEIVSLQEGNLSRLPKPDVRIPVLASKSGKVTKMNVTSIGDALVELGVGRRKTSDPVDPAGGIEVHVKLGSNVEPGDTLFTIMTSRSVDSSSAIVRLKGCLELSDGEGFEAPELLANTLCFRS